ncbi:MAG: glycosyltransferase [Saprospiraceae bacterium]|nr:glycosyltransferase [Saprospiraceae bacterium]
MKNGIVIPCYNESNRLPLDQYDAFIKEDSNYILCFVNDGSNDDTLEVLQKFKNKRDRVYVYDMPCNKGKAEAVRHGIKHMLQETNVSNVGFLDADLSTDFNDYKRLVKSLNDSTDLQMTFGSRKMGNESQIERKGFRSIASMVAGLMIKFILGLPIKDTQCGAKVFSRNAASYCFTQPFHTRWLFDVELFVRFKSFVNTGKVMSFMREIPLLKWMDVEGSKITINDSIQIPLQLLNIAYQYNVKPSVKSNFQTIMYAIWSMISFQKVGANVGQ